MKGDFIDFYGPMIRDIERYLGISTLASIPMMEEAEYDGERRTTSKGKNKKKNVGKPKREAVR